MKKILQFSLICLMAVFGVLPCAQAQTVWDGTADITWYDATQTSFDISTPEQLAGVAQLVNNGTTTFDGTTLNLTADLWLNADNDSTYNWVPIGGGSPTSESPETGNSFKGNFNGHGHTIYNLYCDKGNTFHAGLFSRIQYPCTIDSLVMINPVLKALGMMGCIAGFTRDGSGAVYIRHCMVINARIESPVTPSNSNNSACILGAAYNSNAGSYIQNCGATGTLTGHYVAGICASGDHSNLTNCYFAGTLNDYGSNHGGMTAWAGVLTNCYSYTNVSAAAGKDGISKTSTEMQSDSMIILLGDAFTMDPGVNNNYPVLSYMFGIQASTQVSCAGQSVTLTGVGYDSYLWDNGAVTESITVSPTTTTTYSVTGTLGTISSSHSFTLTVYPQAVISAAIVAGSDGLVHGMVTPDTSYVTCMGSDNITLTVTPDAGYRIESVTLNGEEVYGDELGPGEQVITISPNGSMGSVMIYLSKCAILTLPFTDDFESYSSSQVPECYTKISDYSYPYVYSSSAHSGSKCIYTYMYGSTYNYYLALPKMFDMNTYPMETLMVSFWARTSNVANSVTVGVMSDPTDASTFTPIETFTFATTNTYEPFTAYFGDMAEGKPYIAFKMNCGSSYTYTYIDDILVDVAPSCSQVTHLTVDNIYGTNASLHWNPNVVGETVEYIITVTDASGLTFTETTTETDYILSGLDELTTYTVAVQPDCGGGDYGAEETVSFTTPCIAPIEAINNSYPTSTYTTEGNHFPMSNHYLNSFTEQIYFPSDFNDVTAEFSGMSFQYNDGQEITRTLDIFMAHTADSVFVQNVWATPTDDYVHVYSGPVTFNTAGTNRWVDIAFDTNFYYNGYDNLLLIVNDITGSEVNNSNAKFYTINTNTNRSQCKYTHDANDNWSITNMPTSGTLHTQVNNIRLMACDQVTCITPNTLALGTVDANSAEISWFNPNASQNCEIEYKANGEADWISTGTISGSEYTLYGLEGNTVYQVRVRAICGNNEESLPTEAVSFRTECAPLTIDDIPYIQNFDGDDHYGSGEDAYIYCWDRYTNNASSPVYYSTSTSAHSLSGMLRFDDGSNVVNIAIMPKVDESISLSELEISFWVKNTSASSTAILELGVMTDKNDPTTFETLDTIHPQVVNQYNLIEYSMENYTGYGQYIAFRASNGNGGNNLRLDDVTLDYIPVCAHPVDLVVDETTSETVTIHWSEVGSATGWIVEYGPAGFEPGDGMVETANDTTYTVNGLNPNTEYDIYVWSDCGVGFISTPINTTFRTDCGPIVELPYTENFESGIYSTSQDNYILCWSRFASDPAHYVYVPSNSYAHGGTHFLDFHHTTDCYNIAIAPELDQSLDVSQLMVNFWACRTGASGTLEVGVMTDKDDETTFVTIDTIDLSAMNTYAYAEQFVSLSSYQGTGKYIAFRVSYASSCGFYIDDVVIDYEPACSPINNLEVSDISTSSALFSWTDGPFGTVDSYTLEYAESGTEAWTTVNNITESPYLLGGLDYATYYDVRVRPNCDNTSTGDWQMVTFRTNCLVGGDVTIGEGTATNNYLPSYGLYNYSYTQQLFLSEEMGAPRNIESVTFDMANYAVNRTYKIYLMHTSATSASDWIDASNAELVFDTVQQLQAGLNTFQFSTPFYYNGADNLLLIVLDMTGSWQSGNTWRTHTAPFTASRYIYQDASAYSTTSTPSSGSSSSTTARNNVIFGSPCDNTTTCVAPNMNITAITSNSATVNWVAGYQESAWEMEYKVAADSVWTPVGTLTTMSETLSGLQPNTAYKVRMRSVCDGDYSYWAETNFTTACGAISAPWFEDFEGYTQSTLICWETPITCLNGSNTFPMVYRNYGQSAHSGGNTIEFKGNTNMLVLPEFTNDIHTLRMSFWATQYGSGTSAVVGVISDVNDTATFEVLGDAGTPGPRGSAAGGNGNYMGPFDFNNVQATSGRIAILFTGNGSGNGWNMDDFTVELIPNCPSPVKNSVVVSPVTSNEATVTWIDNNPDHNSWTVYYKPSSADENSWLTAIASQNSVTLTGLTSLTEYQVYVVTNCSVTDDTPDATFTETFTTLPSCPVPTGLTISNILSSSADIYWVAGANESEWEIEYGLENFVHGSGTIVSTTTIPYPLQNLSPNTKYDVYVRAVCSTSENSEWSSKESFRTACDAFPLPLTENFDSYDDWYSPDCWKKFETPNVTGYAYIYGTYAYSGSKSLKIGTNYSSDYYGFIRLPLLDATSLSDLQISFKAMKSSGSSHPLQVCVSPDYESIANLTVIASIDTLTSSWTDVTVPFSGYTGTGMYIVIGVPSGYNESCTFWVDDVVVDYADSTPVVIITDPTVTTDVPTDITQTTAKLNGTIINPDNVTINTQGFEWKATNGGTYTGVSASGNPMSYTLTGLSPNMSITYRAFIVTASGPHYGQEVVFTTLPEDVPEPCDVPTGLTATDIQAESITISWENAAVLRWNIQYAPQDGTLASATASTNSYTISNLTPETTYQIQVQAVCEENNVSEWSAPISVTTLVGIHSYLENSVTLYPNPAKEYVDVRVDGDVNVTGMEVYDVYGKVVRTDVGANNDSPIRINVSGLANGMYFVRVTTDRGVVTKRFVKK